MPLRLDVKKRLNTHTDRVKCVAFHTTDPLVLSALFSGVLMIHNWETQSLVKSVEVSQHPIRSAKFIIRKQWIIAAGDDSTIRVYNHNTLEKIKEIEAHSDFIRYLAVHSTLPYVLSAADDLTVKMWDWERDWAFVQSFEGHTHYVMMCQWNPKDPHIFATCSLDRTIKIWGISSAATSSVSTSVPVTTPHFVLNGHERGVNSIEYSSTGEKPYIVSASDDKTVRIWDYQTKQCIAVLKGHTHNVSAAIFHPRLPLIISASEDGNIRLWHSSTYKLESTISNKMDRAWTLATLPSSNAIAIGFDEGTLVLKLGSETPPVSMQGGKIVWAKGSEIQTANIKLVDESLYSDGERLPLSIRDLGSCDIFPQSISHHPNGRLISVCGDEEYVIYTSQALRSKAYGKALELEWSPEGHFAIRDEAKIVIFHDFKEHFTLRPAFAVEAIFGGRLLGLRSADFICFYDWQDCRMIRRIDVCPKAIWWNESADLVCLACPDEFFILSHDKDVVTAAIVGGAVDADDGIECAFDLAHEVTEQVMSGAWVSGCFIFVTASLRLQSFIAGQVETIAFLDRPMTIIGYMPEYNRIYLVDKELSVLSYTVDLALIEYICAICRKDFDAAAQKFPKIPESLHNRVARFLVHQGHKEDAMAIATDAEYRFELALSLGKLDMCAQTIQAAQEAALSSGESTDVANSVNLQKWRQLGDAALERGKLDLAEACFGESKDSSGLMLLAVSSGDASLLEDASRIAKEQGKQNVAIISQLLLGNLENCLQLLIDAGRIPEAAFFARTYCPSQITRVVQLWRKDLAAVNEQLANSLADPESNPELFPNFAVQLQAEQLQKEKRAANGLAAAADYAKERELLSVDLVEEIQKLGYEKVRAMFLGEASSQAPSPSSDLLTKPPPPPSAAAAAAPSPAASPIPFHTPADPMAAAPPQQQPPPRAASPPGPRAASPPHGARGSPTRNSAALPQTTTTATSAGDGGPRATAPQSSSTSKPAGPSSSTLKEVQDLLDDVLGTATRGSPASRRNVSTSSSGGPAKKVDPTPPGGAAMSPMRSAVPAEDVDEEDAFQEPMDITTTEGSQNLNAQRGGSDQAGGGASPGKGTSREPPVIGLPGEDEDGTMVL